MLDSHQYKARIELLLQIRHSSREVGRIGGSTEEKGSFAQIANGEAEEDNQEGHEDQNRVLTLSQ